MRTTMKDVAREAGVSAMTVSLALRNAPRISPATRLRVKEAAKRLGYQPDPALSALVAHRGNLRRTRDLSTIAFVTNWRKQHEWKQSYANEFFEGAQMRAAQAGYALDPFWLRDYKHHRAASQVLWHRGIRGLLIAPLPRGFSHMNLEWGRFAAVSMGLSLARPLLHRVSHDYQASAALAIHHLRRLGYRKIALAIPKRVSRLSDHRVPGVFWEEWRRTNQGGKPLYWIEGSEDRGSFLRWFRRTRPEAIVCLQQHFLAWLTGDGLRVPEDVGFVNLHIPPGMEATSGILYGGQEIGAAAVDLLKMLLLNNETGVPAWQRQLTVAGHWNPGGTLRKLP